MAERGSFGGLSVRNHEDSRALVVGWAEKAGAYPGWGVL